MGEPTTVMQMVELASLSLSDEHARAGPGPATTSIEVGVEVEVKTKAKVRVKVKVKVKAKAKAKVEGNSYESRIVFVFVCSYLEMKGVKKAHLRGPENCKETGSTGG
ncbi:hypothetical protein VMCG_03530 [Cytospora schulzeri]|uniref:Uncharacterized protein n=1 Tax=Cytospora schulzeri TaxID=448051 RepID=A0A423WWW3_9PEZI|nr:hypothetical protein VMCG_03530 [Valsa malicola]